MRKLNTATNTNSAILLK